MILYAHIFDSSTLLFVLLLLLFPLQCYTYLGFIAVNGSCVDCSSYGCRNCIFEANLGLNGIGNNAGCYNCTSGNIQCLSKVRLGILHRLETSTTMAKVIKQ